MPVSRKGHLLLAFAAAALSMLAIALGSAPSAHAQIVCDPSIPGCPGYIDPTCATIPHPGCPGYDPCLPVPTPGCPGVPLLKMVSLQVMSPAEGKVTLPPDPGPPALPAMECTAATPLCLRLIMYTCPTGPASCAAAAPTVILTASDGPAGKVPQWSSNCTPETANTCAAKVVDGLQVTLTWVDPPADPPANGGGTTTPTPTPTDEGRQQQQTRTVVPAKAECKVPKLKGKTLAAAKKALKKANCALGKVKRKKARGKPGRVIAQSVKAGKRKPKGAKVALTLSRRA